MSHAASLRNVIDSAPGDVASGVVGRAPAVELKTLEGDREWLVTNERGAFAIGSVDRVLRRKYHSILTVNTGSGAENLLADVIERVTVGETEFSLQPAGRDSETTSKPPELHGFSCREHPVWVYDLGGARLRRELVLSPDADSITIRYELSGADSAELSLEPLLLYRPIHAIAGKDLFLDGRVHPESADGTAFWIEPYDKRPRLHVGVSVAGGGKAHFEVRGVFRELVHEWEGERGYERGEFAFSPGRFTLRLSEGRIATLTLGTGEPGGAPASRSAPSSGPRSSSIRAVLEHAATSFLVSSASPPAIAAGYPWLGESPRQTLIALPAFAGTHRGFVLAVLESIAANLDRGSYAEAVDVPLLFVRAVEVVARASFEDRAAALTKTAASVLRRFASGADPRVHLSLDGLLFVTPGPWALTWMDAKVDGRPVTARSGYAVEINALFLNALAFLSRTESKTPGSPAEPWASLLERASAAFRRFFWSDERGYLADTHDGSTPDGSLRPNQLWAVALPYSALTRAERLAVVDAVKEHLLTDVGIRTLAPGDRRYQGRYEGGVASRERAAHQGSVWPFLLGLYADALALLAEPERLREDLLPVMGRLERHAKTEGCLGYITELFDGDAPHEPRGAPAHVGSVAEVLRVARMVER